MSVAGFRDRASLSSASAGGLAGDQTQVGGRGLSLKLANGEMAPISMTEFFGGPLWPYYASEDWIELLGVEFSLSFLTLYSGEISI